MLLKGLECKRTFADIKANCLRSYSESNFKNVSNYQNLESIRKINSGFFSDWAGGNWNDLTRQLESGVDNYAEWIKQSEHSVQIETKRNRRRRYWSDIDGDIDFDRRWEDKPYQAITRIQVPTHILHLYVNANFNGQVRADAIIKYGIQIFRAINALEAAGRTVDLTVYFTSRSMFKTNNQNVLMLVKVKEPGVYTNPATLATTLTPIFLRKAIFQEECLLAEELNDAISYGHGSAVTQLRRNITVEGDNVYIEPPNLSTFGDEDIKKLIQELIGAEQVA